MASMGVKENWVYRNVTAGEGLFGETLRTHHYRMTKHKFS